MKRHFTLLTFTLSFIGFTIQAQTLVPNANMESWQQSASYDNPVSWSTPNVVTVNLGAGAVVFQDSTNVNSGNYAARMVCVQTILGKVPGAMGTGVLDVANQTFSGGFQLSNPNVVTLIGYFKYSPVGNDSCLLYSILTKWDVANSERDTIAVTAFVAGSTANYTAFSSPFFVMDSTQLPDTALIICSTTNNYDSAQVGSTLWIDDIDFSGTVSIPGIRDVKVSAYPIPADQVLEITLPQNMDSESILISNIAGTMVKVLRTSSSLSTTINTAKFAEGVYVIFVRNKEGNVIASGKFTVKH